MLVAFASPAIAQDSAIDDGYGGAGAPTTTTDRLPFSGLDLALIAAGGVLFVLAGVGLRRAARAS